MAGPFGPGDRAQQEPTKGEGGEASRYIDWDSELCLRGVYWSFEELRAVTDSQDFDPLAPLLSSIADSILADDKLS